MAGTGRLCAHRSEARTVFLLSTDVAKRLQDPARGPGTRGPGDPGTERSTGRTTKARVQRNMPLLSQANRRCRQVIYFAR